MSSIEHFNLVPFICTFLLTLSTIIDSIYTPVINLVKTELTPVVKMSILLRAEVLLYVILIGMRPGNTTLHIRLRVSLLESMVQLYDSVSPGQSISDLNVIISEELRDMDAVRKQALVI